MIGHQAGASKGGTQRRLHPSGILKEIARHHAQTWTTDGETTLKNPKCAQDHHPRGMIGGITGKDPLLTRGTQRAVTVQGKGQRLLQGISRLAKSHHNGMSG